MNNLRLWNLVFLLVFITPWTVRSELLIFKTDENGFLTVLTDEESVRHSNLIGSILLQYKWPESLASKLTEFEENALLTSKNNSDITGFAQGKEEYFIQKKLQEVLPELHLQVSFIPTSLYELFCLLEEHRNYYNPGAFENSLKDAQRKSLYEGFSCIKIQPLLVGVHKSLQSINKSINALCMDVNELFYMGLTDEQESAFMFVNNKIVKFLLSFLALSKEKDALIVSREIFHSSFSIYKNLIDQFKVFPLDPTDLFDYLKPAQLNQAKIDQLTRLISKIIQLEYEAHRSNKALLLRGSKFRSTPINFKLTPATGLVAGNTVNLEQEQFTNILKLYKNKNLTPYSISFANSFFAGFVQDKDACAYYYLMDKSEDLTSTGYGLFVNKQEYVKNQINNLFFIPAFSTLAALFQSGEFFHARTKVAVAEKQASYAITGLYCENFRDPHGFFVIEEDPLKFAERFARYLVTNGQIIQLGMLSGSEEVEKQFINDVMKSQRDVANFYRDIRKIKKILDQDVAPRYKAKKERRASAEQQKLLNGLL